MNSAPAALVDALAALDLLIDYNFSSTMAVLANTLKTATNSRVKVKENHINLLREKPNMDITTAELQPIFQSPEPSLEIVSCQI